MRGKRQVLSSQQIEFSGQLLYEMWYLRSAVPNTWAAGKRNWAADADQGSKPRVGEFQFMPIAINVEIFIGNYRLMFTMYYTNLCTYTYLIWFLVGLGRLFNFDFFFKINIETIWMLRMMLKLSSFNPEYWLSRVRQTILKSHRVFFLTLITYFSVECNELFFFSP